MSTVISVENLGKKYTISHQQRGDSSSLREVITNSVSSFGKKMITPFRRSPAPCPLPLASASQEDFWALKDVSFEVKQGDRIGIIGRNGAGKSTLLKILSRITEPTTGRVKIKGRVASLLEVGTGFHPELTGRENIYLNGAILGMGREEISRKFDEIVDFAEIEKFLDTPVKRYSSGMYVRLAFAVAAHLEPEILIVDEVLAVGDAQFQKKCLGKMEEVGMEGRTVIFVSHNMNAVRNLCRWVILLNEGRVVVEGAVDEVVNQYLKFGARHEANNLLLPHQHRIPAEQFEICQVDILNSDGIPTTSLLCGEMFSLRFSWRMKVKGSHFRIGAVFRAMDSTLLATVVSSANNGTLLTGELDKLYQSIVRLQNPFLPGTYQIDINVKNNLGSYVDAIDGITFTVEPVAVNKGETLPFGGHIWLAADWSPPEIK